jgi:hypothetical protein
MVTRVQALPEHLLRTRIKKRPGLYRTGSRRTYNNILNNTDNLDDIRALVKGPGLTACTVRTTASPGDRFRGRTFG